MPDWIPITAKFHSSCIECLGDIEAGDQILWQKGAGTKHKQCPEEIQKTHELEVEEDYTSWKDSKIYSYVEVQKIENCQKCGKYRKGKDEFLQASEQGFRAVCEECS